MRKIAMTLRSSTLRCQDESGHAPGREDAFPENRTYNNTFYIQTVRISN